jgi:hypothetical protein
MCAMANQIIAKGSTTQIEIRLAIFCSAHITDAGGCSFIRSF